MSNSVTAHQPYGPLKEGQSYRLHEIGFDYHKVQAQGKILFVPSYVFEPRQHERERDFDE